MSLERLYATAAAAAQAGVLPSFFAHSFMVRGALAALLIGPLLGSVGPLVTVHGLAFFVQTVGHAALTGVALGLLIGEPVGATYVGLYGFCPLIAVLMLFLRNRLDASADTVTGVVLAQILGLGIVMLILVTQRFNIHQVEGVLFGSLLTVTETDLLVIACLAVGGTVLLAWLANRLLLIAFSPAIARARGLPVTVLEYLIVVLVTWMVVASLAVIGALLVLALVVIPAAAAQRVAGSLGGVFRWSIVLATCSSVGGFLLSAVSPIPTGAAIVLVASAVFYLALAVGAARGHRIPTPKST